MSLPRHHVLYLGDHPSQLTLTALDRAGAHSDKVARFEHRIGNRRIVELRPLDHDDPELARSFAVTPTALGLTGIATRAYAEDGTLLGQHEDYIEVRPADGHTISHDLGAPDASLAPPPPPQAGADEPVASSRGISEKIVPGAGAPTGPSAERVAKSEALRKRMAVAAGLPETAGYDEIEDKLAKDDASIVLEPGKKNGGA